MEPYTESPSRPRPKKGETSEEQSQEHDHHFLWHQEDCSQIIRPGRPNSQLRILLRQFTATAWLCYIITTYCFTFPFSPVNLWAKTTWLSSPTYRTFLFSRLEKLKDRHFDIMRCSRQNRRRCWTPTQNTTFRMHLKWQKRWERCIRAEGDYFEGDGGQ
jgi:hypothetical protein